VADGKRLCLIADDEETVRIYLRATLEQAHFRVVEASNGNDALTLLNQLGDAVDIVVSDFHMCGGDGLRFVLNARESYPTLPIVLISGIVKPAGKEPAHLVEFVQKPFVGSTLLAAMDRAIGRMQSQGAPDG